MMHLHVISFDIPYPANYGGVIDVYYKIRALTELGVRIHLHCFEYGRFPAEELDDLCEEVYYYPRKTILNSLPVRYPHIVRSRSSDELLARLLMDDIPILFEGLHTTFYLSHPDFEHRLKIVRMHNIEWEYYYQLSQRENRYWQKKYFEAESRQLQYFENILSFSNKILTISPKDTDYYKEKFEGVVYVPAFHPYSSVSSKSGVGKYCIYHGKLSVAENHEAAMFLIYEVFADMGDIPLIIAGSDPLPELIEAINSFDHISLRHNPGEAEMIDLLREAHVHVLPTFQATGIKLKLINSLFTGRFCVANSLMVSRTGLEFNCIVANEPAEFQKEIRELFRQAFTEIDIAQRKASLNLSFNNERNARKILDLLEGFSPIFVEPKS
ncbi:MAG: glycosyltransferase [Bacteroidia bacterium]|nr:glycosyltransferase [Bacteroidia bacterium]